MGITFEQTLHKRRYMNGQQAHEKILNKEMQIKTIMRDFPGGAVVKNPPAWQRINLQNLQAAHAAQYQKNKQPNPKLGRRPK